MDAGRHPVCLRPERGAAPAGPRLDAALERLHNPPRAIAGGDVPRAGRWIAARVAPRLRVPTKELHLLGKSTERYALEKVGLETFALQIINEYDLARGEPVLAFMDE